MIEINRRAAGSVGVRTYVCTCESMYECTYICIVSPVQCLARGQFGGDTDPVCRFQNLVPEVVLSHAVCVADEEHHAAQVVGEQLAVHAGDFRLSGL
jgi:hypothetical protein